MDRLLVLRAQGGDRAAYDALARASVDRLYAAAIRIAGDADGADDAVQAALVAMWRDLPSLRDPDRFEAWSYRLVVGRCLADLRRVRRRTVRRLVDDEPIPARDELGHAELRDELHRALQHLSAEHRAVVVLHHYAGVPLGEIAEILGIPYGTVGSRLHHATRSLRAAIDAGDRSALTEGRLA